MVLKAAEIHKAPSDQVFSLLFKSFEQLRNSSLHFHLL
jgi:hypothetical protein